MFRVEKRSAEEPWRPEDFIASAGDRLADDFLDRARSLHLSRVDVRHPQVEPLAKRRPHV